MESDKETIATIIREARSGKQVAFSQLLDRYWPEVYHFQLGRTQNENDAEDIAIQTFARAFDKLDTYDPKFAFNTWLIAISKNLHVDLLRKRKRNVLEQREKGTSEAMKKILDDSPSAEDQLITQQNLNTLTHHLKQLKPAYRKVLDLRYFGEMSYTEIAEHLNEPIGTVKVKLLRAKKLLAEHITRQGNPD